MTLLISLGLVVSIATIGLTRKDASYKQLATSVNKLAVKL